MTVLDLTKLKAGDLSHHGKFAESPEIVQLIGKRLTDGQAMTDRGSHSGTISFKRPPVRLLRSARQSVWQFQFRWQ